MISIKRQSPGANRFSVTPTKPNPHWQTEYIAADDRTGFWQARSSDDLFGYGRVLTNRVAPKTRERWAPDIDRLRDYLQNEAWLQTNAPETPWELMAWGHLADKHFWAVEQPIARFHGEPPLPEARLITGKYPSKLIVVSDPDNQLGLHSRKYKPQIDALISTSDDRILWDPPLGKVNRYLASGYTMVIFIGHATYDAKEPEQSRFFLAGNQHLTPSNLLDNLDGHPLVLFIACVTARHEPQGEGLAPMPALGFVPACLDKGSIAFIGPLWEIEVEGGLWIANRLLKYLNVHLPAEALRRTRCDALYQRPEDATWAAFVVYQNQRLNTLPVVEETGHPQKIGRYEIQRELGRGAHSIVYLAHDPELKRQIAIKTLTGEAVKREPTLPSRFEREARMIAALEKNSAILPVYDVGKHENQPYIVMGYAKGGTLKEHLAGDHLPPGEVQRIVHQIASGLDYIHDNGIVHRDLKPANIFFGNEDQVLLGDFGIARRTEESQHLTESGTALGTVAYMSPEQCRGEKDIDGRSDIYSLGIILFELLTGQRPFQGESVSLIAKHLYEPTPDPCEFNSALPQAVKDVIWKATAKSPGHRFSTASELATALEKAFVPRLPPKVPGPELDTILEPVPVPSGEKQEPLPWPRRLLSKPVWLIILSMLFIALVLLGITWIRTVVQEPPIPTPGPPPAITFTITCGNGREHNIPAGEAIFLETDNAILIEPSILPETFEAATGVLRKEPGQAKVFSYTPGNIGDTLTFTFVIDVESSQVTTKLLNIIVAPTSVGLCS